VRRDEALDAERQEAVLAEELLQAVVGDDVALVGRVLLG
jgi:hypothetical protein